MREEEALRRDLTRDIRTTLLGPTKKDQELKKGLETTRDMTAKVIDLCRKGLPETILSTMCLVKK